MTVRLSLLDRINSLSYSEYVPVSIFDGKYREIGACRIYRDVQGNHIGVLDLQEEVSSDLFFYYRSRANEDGVFLFSGLDFMITQQEQNPTTQLKEMIICK